MLSQISPNKHRRKKRAEEEGAAEGKRKVDSLACESLNMDRDERNVHIGVKSSSGMIHSRQISVALF